MTSSEFEAMTALYQIMPEMVARPVACGSYESSPDTYFFVCEFRELSDDIPDPYPFASLMAELHKRGVNAEGKFGMPIVTFGGNNPQFFPVTENWEECFTTGIQAIFAAELKTHGPDENIEELTNAILEKVIPRLLRPLETEGRTVTPRLVHGDLWDGNTAVDVNTGNPMIYDATPLYAHNECKFSSARVQMLTTDG
jgi:protein-ribulosamine 3-kinase